MLATVCRELWAQLTLCLPEGKFFLYAVFAEAMLALGVPKFIMRAVSIIRRVGAAVCLVLAALAAGSCRKREAVRVVVPPVFAPELATNRVGGLPGGVYASQANSAIRWQPWELATFERAAKAKRLVFLVIAMPQYLSFYEVLGDLERDAAMVALINNNYVPVLVDGEAAREVGLLMVDLAGEIKQPVQPPMLVWVTPEINPVAWIPVPAGQPGKIREMFDKAHSMVIRTWESSPDYVSTNSELDNGNRRERIAKRKNASAASEEPAVDVVRAIRQLASLYDPVSRSFDDAGGLFPTGGIEALAAAVLCPAVHEEIRARSLRTLKELMTDLLPSAMFDPLDGGLFARRGGAWALPVFERDGNRQAQAVTALCRVYQATGDATVLARALGVLDYVEKTNATADGLFALGVSPPKPTRQWLWTVEDVQKALPPEDAAWWIKATAMRGLGNLPAEVDLMKVFWRLNSFGMGKPKAAIAAELALTPEAFEARYESVRKRLLEIRTARMGVIVKDETAHAATTFRMVSAYAAAYCVTGDPALRDRAVKVLTQARKTFCEGANLWLYPTKTVASISAGRAFLYALALQASLDVADVTEDDSWLRWAEDLASTAAERFAATDYLKECADDAKVFDLPITDVSMFFDESTAGLISAVEGRLAARGRPLVESFTRLATPLPQFAVNRPILHTDLIQATLVRHHAALVVMGKELPEALKTAVARLPLRLIKRRAANAGDQVSTGAVKIILPDGTSQEATTPEGLQKVLLPSVPIR
jgi:uncharacterized protein YyaL (SSP411 family)